ncbi:MAG: RDD family protein [Nitrospirota bacterium]
MQKADITTRAVAGFIDLLLVIGMARLPDVLGFLVVIGYILVRDGLFAQQSVGKKVIGLRVALTDDPGKTVSFRESIIRNVPLAVAYLLFLVPYAGWLLAPLALTVEALTAMGDERGMRIGDLLARTYTVQANAAAAVPEGPAADAGMSDTTR